MAVRYLTFSRPYPRWLDPRRFDRAPQAAGPEPAARPALDYRSPRSWRETARAIASEHPDVLLAPWWTAFWGLPFARVFRRVSGLSPATLRVLLCHNVHDHESGLLHRGLAARAFASADAFVVHAQSDRRRLEARVPRSPIAVLPHPVVSPRAPDREAARRELGVTTPLVLFLGLVRRYKGVELLLDAAPRIVRETGARIAIVGEVFPEAKAIERRWRSRNPAPVRQAVLWRDDYVSEEEMSRWLTACDVVVLPYRYVSGSGIAARAVSAGRPMAAASVGGLVETVEPGVTGELFAPGDPSGLAEAVARVLRLGIAHYEPGLAHAAEEASWPRYVDALLAFFGSSGGERTRGNSGHSAG